MSNFFFGRHAFEKPSALEVPESVYKRERVKDIISTIYTLVNIIPIYTFIKIERAIILLTNSPRCYESRRQQIGLCVGRKDREHDCIDSLKPFPTYMKVCM